MPKHGGARKGAGRPSGSTQNRSGMPKLQAAMAEAGCNPYAIMTAFAMDRLECTRCDENGMMDPLVSFAMRKSSSQEGHEKATAASEAGELERCPLCAGTKYKFLADGEQYKATARMLDSLIPKLSSITLEDNSGRTTFVRMNAVVREQQEELARRMKEQEEQDKKDAGID